MNKFVSTTRQRELILGLGIICLPFFLYLSYGALFFFYFIIGFRYLSLSKKPANPPRRILLLLTIAGGIIVWLQANGILGKTSGASLLLVGTCLKFLEVKTKRDLYIIISLALLLVLTQFLFSQAIFMALYLFFALTIICALLLGLHVELEVFPFVQRLRKSAFIIFQSLPLALLLFLFSPRITGPLWSLPEEKPALTGLGDKLEPGSITQLGLSSELAFRVNFVTAPPPQNQLYWRGPVFWWTDGKHWEMRNLPNLDLEHAPVFYQGTAVDYSIVLEPHGQKWLLALDLPQMIPADSHLTLDFQLLSNANVLNRRLYALRSYPVYAQKTLTSFERRLGLQLPANQLDLLYPLVTHWRVGHTDPEVIALALAYFRNNHFFYTLNPPLLLHHPIEQFLLETRRGFCEHYATAFVVLMRLAEIPARVVTGYQGGQWNELGKFLEIRQSDAHAWAEVWLEDQGWVRIDPTAAIAPERIEKPFDAASINIESLNTPTWQKEVSVLWSKSLRIFWANLDHGWHRWVLSYDRDSRARLLQWFDAAFSWHWLLGLIAAVLMCCIPFLFLYGRDFFNHHDPVQRYYLWYCRKLADLGLPRRPCEGPLDYSQRASMARPDLAAKISDITRLYVLLRYGSVFDRNLTKMLRFHVSQL
ncbi:MAG: DUF3488 domain-containing protein [Methylococcaceae bacterium]|nr:MAG: DUF3488 domain-containing protein [Methylococcaceae bacterium]